MNNKITTAIAKYKERRAEQKRSYERMTDHAMVSMAALAAHFVHQTINPAKTENDDRLVEVEYLSSMDLKEYLKYHPGTDGFHSLIYGLEKKDLEDLSIAIDMRLKEL